MTDAVDTPVLVVGGGPVGLILAIQLGQAGVRCVLVDRRPEPAFLPKMERCNARTMEIFRRMGIVDQVRQAGLPSDIPMDVFVTRTLTDPPIVHLQHPSVDAYRLRIAAVNDGSQPLEPYQLISQYTLEPLLKEIAEGIDGVDVRFGTELLSFTQDESRVTALLKSGDGDQTSITADYMVGCDGGGSRVRQELGIVLEGESNIMEMRQGLFRCDGLFERITTGRGRHYHMIDAEQSFMIVQDDTKHFSLHAKVERDEDMVDVFRRSMGEIDLPFATLYIGKWTQRLMLADGYRRGRVFIAGDAAHLVIPTGGLGMNTGAGDSTDLAWKLAAVLSGWGGPALLDSYEAERRPVGERNVATSTQGSFGRRAWRGTYRPEMREDGPAGDAARAEFADTIRREEKGIFPAIELGYVYVDSPVIFNDGAPDEMPRDKDRYVPRIRPGARVPHIWLADGRPLQDRLGSGFTLVRLDDDDEEPSDPLLAAFRDLGAPIEELRIADSNARTVLGGGMLLLRPDLHIAWLGEGLPLDPHVVARIVTGHQTSGGHPQ